MYRNYEAVIFDMDGTLIDSMWIWKRVDEKFFKQHDIAMPETLQKDIESLSMDDTAKYFLEHFPLNYTPEELIGIWNDMAHYEYRNEVFYKEGALEFIEQLKKTGVKMGIATSNSRELVEAVDEHLHFMKYMDCVITSKEVPNGKPNPDIYLAVAEKLAVKPEKCLVFEDVIGGLTAGIRAGMDTCAVQDSFSYENWEEKRKMATFAIESYTELLEK